MPRRFNTTGHCLADKHYMLPATRRLTQVRALIDKEHYFIVHAPRQTGKTTLLRNLSRELTEEGKYAAITVSLESFTRPEVAEMMPQILWELGESAKYQLPANLAPPEREEFVGDPDIALRGYLAKWSASISRPLVVFFDEIDSIPGPVLLSVLRQLRNGYTSRPAPFPQSVALVGLRDIRDYRIRIRPDSESLGTASPFNIKERSLTLRNFTEDEVNELLDQHVQETGQAFEPAARKEIFVQTQGQPWLVNALASQLTTSYDALVPDPGVAVTREKVMEAREILIERRDTHLDSLVDKLREERVRQVIQPILTGALVANSTYDDDFSYVRDLGLVAVRGGVRTIANPMYQEIIPRVLTHQVQTAIPDEPAWYIAQDGTLDMRKLIKGFIDFWRRHGEVLLQGMPYQEAAPHLVFMAYLQRIVNAGGRIDREFAIGTGRADLVVDFGGRQDLIELKVLRDKYSLPDGLDQVARYAKRLARGVGYLVLFDLKTQTPFEDRGEVQDVEHEGVTVVVVRV
jgi:type II secretory pathway predicted ATPase ExeA